MKNVRTPQGGGIFLTHTVVFSSEKTLQWPICHGGIDERIMATLWAVLSDRVQETRCRQFCYLLINNVLQMPSLVRLIRVRTTGHARRTTRPQPDIHAPVLQTTLENTAKLVRPFDLLSSVLLSVCPSVVCLSQHPLFSPSKNDQNCIFFDFHILA